MWKENYRLRKLFWYADHPIKPKDPKLIEYERQAREREQAEHNEFNRKQQERYEKWLRKWRPS